MEDFSLFAAQHSLRSLRPSPPTLPGLLDLQSAIPLLTGLPPTQSQLRQTPSRLLAIPKSQRPSTCPNRSFSGRDGTTLDCPRREHGERPRSRSEAQLSQAPYPPVHSFLRLTPLLSASRDVSLPQPSQDLFALPLSPGPLKVSLLGAEWPTLPEAGRSH